MAPRTTLFTNYQPGGMFAVQDVARHPGAVFFVDSATGVDGEGYGHNPGAPLATIAAAIALCTGSKGDVVYLMPGHNENFGNAQLALSKAGVSVVGLGAGALRPRIDFDHGNASIDVTANGVTIRNLVLLPSSTAVLVAIDVNAAVTDTLIEDVEVLPGEDGAGVDEFAVVVDVKAGCSRTVVRRLKVRQHASAAGCIAGVKLTGASDDVTIEDCDIETLGAAAVAPINADTTLSTGLRIRRCTLVSDTQPGIEVITGTTGVVQDCDIFTNLATIAAAITGAGGASGMAQFRCEYIEVAPESGAVIGTPSAND
jgi:hypothetical protein